MKVSILLFLLSLSLYAFPQDYFTSFIKQDSTKFRWCDYELKNQENLIKSFIQTHQDDFDYYFPKQHDDYAPDIKDLYNGFHVLDINNDGLKDIIFEGNAGSTADCIIIYFNTGRSFKRIFSDLQAIVKMEWVNHKLDKIFTKDWGCCMEFTTYNKVFQCNFSIPSNPKFTAIYSSAFINYMRNPKEYFTNPIDFEVLHDQYTLRFNALIDDTTYNAPTQGNGNVIGFLEQGTKGKAYAKQLDSIGREWWLVEIPFKVKLKKSIVYEPDTIHPNKIGWLSSRYLKIINQ